jgi:L-lysine 6-transaminase
MIYKGYNLVFDTKKSYGSYIVDAITGKKYLDMFSFYGSCTVSHNHPELTKEEYIKEIGALAIHNPSNGDIYTKEYAEFISTFKETCMPSEFKHLFLIAGGSLAVENALKVAFDWKVRKNLQKDYGEIGKKVIHFKEAFHGRSGYTMSLTCTDPSKYQYFPLFKWPRIINPKIRFPLNRENLDIVIKDEIQAVSEIEIILKTFGEDVACIIVEPIQGEGGDNHFRSEFWLKLKQLSLQYDVLLIADEVQTGLGLTGKMWCYQHLGDAPDIIVFGKKTQVCGIMCTDRINDVDNVFSVPSRINSTWNGNLIDMIRCTKMLEIINNEQLVENAANMGDYTINKLNQLQDSYPHLISNIRGKGLMIAFDLPNEIFCNKIKKVAFEKGLIIISCGTRSIRLRPMLDITTVDIDNLYNILNLCFFDLTKE